MGERDIEKEAGDQPGRDQSEPRNKESVSDIVEDRVDAEPVRPVSGRSSKSLSRTRSNNGYGVDDLDDEAALETAPQSDPFEVGWEGGDDDPLCPRSMKTWRKWTIVAITSSGSFCV